MKKPRKPRAPNTAPPVLAERRLRPRQKNSEIIYADLRAAISGLDLPPGTALSEQDLAQRYGVSRTPVREAILRLSEEGLVDVVPQSGTFVSRIRLSLVREAMMARRALEAATVRAATAQANPHYFAQLEINLAEQQRHADAGDIKAFHHADEAFHAAFAQIGRYPSLWALIQQVKVHIDRYRWLTLPQQGRMLLVVQEHGAIVAAMSRGDADTAVALMDEHLSKLKPDMEAFRTLWPHYFIEDLDEADLS